MLYDNTVLLSLLPGTTYCCNKLIMGDNFLPNQLPSFFHHLMGLFELNPLAHQWNQKGNKKGSKMM